MARSRHGRIPAQLALVAQACASLAYAFTVSSASRAFRKRMQGRPYVWRDWAPCRSKRWPASYTPWQLVRPHLNGASLHHLLDFLLGVGVGQGERWWVSDRGAHGLGPTHVPKASRRADGNSHSVPSGA